MFSFSPLTYYIILVSYNIYVWHLIVLLLIFAVLPSIVGSVPPYGIGMEWILWLVPVFSICTIGFLSLPVMVEKMCCCFCLPCINPKVKKYFKNHLSENEKDAVDEVEVINI